MVSVTGRSWSPVPPSLPPSVEVPDDDEQSRPPSGPQSPRPPNVVARTRADRSHALPATARSVPPALIAREARRRHAGRTRGRVASPVEPVPSGLEEEAEPTGSEAQPEHTHGGQVGGVADQRPRHVAEDECPLDGDALVERADPDEPGERSRVLAQREERGREQEQRGDGEPHVREVGE